MTGNKVLLDTNIISEWLKGDSIIADKIDRAEELFIPAIVIGEMFYGARYSKQVEKNIETIVSIAERYQVLQVDSSTAAIYGIVKAVLRKKGKPIPENDIWIASIALQHSLSLVTRDKHFKDVDNLTTIVW
ncbi:MAG: type II toxin-antitoxin system VapC family toxin [Agriterribacter sp.]